MKKMGCLVNREELDKVQAELQSEKEQARAIRKTAENLREENKALQEKLGAMNAIMEELKRMLDAAKEKIIELKDLQYRAEDKITGLEQELQLYSALLYLLGGEGSIPMTKENVKVINRAMHEGITVEMEEGPGGAEIKYKRKETIS